MYTSLAFYAQFRIFNVPGLPVQVDFLFHHT